MPELPEVETIYRALKPVLENQSFVRVQLNRPNLRYPLPSQFEERICHQPILGIRRRAKYMLIDFQHGITLIWHLGMSGKVIISSAGTSPATHPHDHVIFTLASRQQIIYRDPRRFGFIQLVPTLELPYLAPFNTLGPEPLDEEQLPLSAWYSVLQKHKMPIKNALLDQRLIAGIGNIYASEALWQATLSPFRPANSLTLLEASLLLQELRNVLNRAIIAGGSTLRDHALPNGQSGYFQREFRAYKQDTFLCTRCQLTPITKVKQSGRSTYYCPICQQ